MDTDFTAVPDWFAGASAGAGVAVGDLAGDGGRSVVVLVVDAPPGANAGRYRVGHGLTDDGALTGPWSPWRPVPDWGFWENQGAGIALADVTGTGSLDLVVFTVDAPDGPNGGFYRIGRDLGADGEVTGGWTGWTAIPDWTGWQNAGADIAVADVDGDGRPDLVVLSVDAPDGQNHGFYRSGPLGPDGVVTEWRDWAEVPAWWGWENQGAGLAVTDLDGDGRPELVVLVVDNPAGENVGYVSVGWRLEDGRSTDGWGPWERLPGWGFWENSDAALAVVSLGARGMPHLFTLAVDAPVGGSSGWYRVSDLMTDRDMGAEMGVWRLLERDSGVLAVHAALLHTGSVAFFAGSSNDPDNAAAGRFGTAVWHYPSSALSRPATPVDLFCCGHAFLADGRLLAAGGTERYDPFLGLRQAVVFDRTRVRPTRARRPARRGRGRRCRTWPAAAGTRRWWRSPTAGSSRSPGSTAPRSSTSTRRSTGTEPAGPRCRPRRTGRCTGTCSCSRTGGSSTRAASTGRTTASGRRCGTSRRTRRCRSTACRCRRPATRRRACCCRPCRTSG
ncbi:hypothetical protein ACQP04_17270 [Pseudonocardia halophobica]|uniref:hypothetical protein n=1 Tax=Pseudonocardia halophobica TaxID=29401 RepID=UPI003D8C36DF